MQCIKLTIEDANMGHILGATTSKQMWGQISQEAAIQEGSQPSQLKTTLGWFATTVGNLDITSGIAGPKGVARRGKAPKSLKGPRITNHRALTKPPRTMNPLLTILTLHTQSFAYWTQP